MNLMDQRIKLIFFGIPTMLTGLLLAACGVTTTPTATTNLTPMPTEEPATMLRPTAEPTTTSGNIAEQEAKVHSLIQDLSSDNPETVLQAETELVEIGVPALEQLEVAREDPSLTVEQRSKLEEIIAAIEVREHRRGVSSTPTEALDATPLPTEAADSQLRSQINALIQDLKSDSPQVVLQAEEELTNIGAPALPHLRAATADPSLTVEQRSKLEELIAAIELHEGTGSTSP